MKQRWQLQEAKNKLSEVVDLALSGAPQVITRRGREVAILLSYDTYTKLQKPATDLVDFFRRSPLAGEELDFARDRSLPREGMGL